MKAEGHPHYHEVKIICRCGHTLVTRSSYPSSEMSVDICSNCHPFYTGNQKQVRVDDRVSKFSEKFS